ncbi:hypothetical protein [Paenibacillus sp. DMB20]|uniref:hypothetical protein n=1 Tax=Paenibacillus sp. DMB20 TaxID=1642570 RepID=UPI000A659919|nr:hypothetical protein [Paenibacillus sp. DMB20]
MDNFDWDKYKIGKIDVTSGSMSSEKIEFGGVISGKINVKDIYATNVVVSEEKT